jgi:hypothetical protein
MIFFVVPADQTWGMGEYLQQHGRMLAERLRIVTYDEIVAHRHVSLGTYIFAAVDQLLPTEKQIAEQCCQQLARARPDIQLIKRPTGVLCRYQLLKTCFELNRNTFRVRRASEFHDDLRFPVFIRPEGEHTGSLTRVLGNRWQLIRALARASLLGFRLRDLIIVEYCDTADAAGIFRLHCATIVGDTIIPQALVHNRSWITKWEGRLVDAEKAAEQVAFVESNPHAEWLRETFELANIGYGRIDYGVKDGRPQVWEINTNPMIVRRAAAPSTMPAEQQNLLEPVRQSFLRQFGATLAKIDPGVDPDRTVRIDISRQQLRRLEAEKRSRRGLRARRTAISVTAHPAVSLLRRLRAE